jgi:hypothetical protein
VTLMQWMRNGGRRYPSWSSTGLSGIGMVWASVGALGPSASHVRRLLLGVGL